MSTRKIAITILFIVAELILGIVLGETYIGQYSLLSSQQDFGQFLATVLLIYCATVFLLGWINLRLLGNFGGNAILSCIIGSLVVGTSFAIPVFFFPLNMTDVFGLSFFYLILLGLVIGFNLYTVKFVLKRKTP